MATKIITLKEVLGSEESAADLERKMDMFVERTVRRFFEINGSVTADASQPRPDGYFPNYDAALRRGFNLDIFTEGDVAYFLGGLPQELVFKKFREMGVRPVVTPLVVVGRQLSRQQASQIYESYDNGEGRPEIAKALGVGLVAVTDVIMQRDAIVPEITDGLRRLYGNTDYNTPYRFKTK